MNNPEIKIFIVNLRTSTQRRTAMEKEIAKVKERGFTGQFYFFDAINMQEHPEFHEHENVFLSKMHRGRCLVAGEKGCFASHFVLWKKCVELNEAIVVLEDDIELLDGFIGGLQTITGSEYEYVRFMGLHDVTLKKLAPHFSLAYQTVAGTQGYYITPSAAAKLIAKARFWLLPVDKYMDSFYIHGVLNILHVPYLIQEHSNSNETTIHKGTKRGLPVGFRVLYKINWICQKCKRWIYSYRKGLL